MADNAKWYVVHTYSGYENTVAASIRGPVEEIDLARSKVRVVVSMFGRETPVELELDQVEPVQD